VSIFETLKNAIFHHGSQGASGSAPAPVPAGSSAGSSPPPAPTSPAPTASAQPVNIEAVLDQLNGTQAQKLNWRTSIVDLMKLVGVDSSLQHRQELAKELGYTGNSNDSAAMNIWLHKQVMQKLAANGGKVPASLL
jgi:Domain of unknown function (DUF3597)